MRTWSPKDLLNKLKQPRKRSSSNAHVQPEQNVKPSDAHTILDKLSIPPFEKRIDLWVLTIFCLCGAVLWLPSIASVAFFAAAALTCPIKSIRDRIPLQDLLDAIPFPIHLSLPVARASLAGTLFILGAICAPPKGHFTVDSYLDFKSAKAEVTEAIEYSRSPVNVFDYIECSGTGVQLDALDDINASKVGTQQMTVELSESVFSKQEELEVQVQDTQAPEIELAANRVQVELGEDYDVHDNIVAVNDPVDGKLVLNEKEPSAKGTAVGKEQFYDEGWYHVIGDVETSAAGTVTVTVKALDKHGNEATEAFTVEVVDPLEDVSIEPKTSILEYSNKSIEATSLITCSDADTAIKAENKVDLQKVGKQTVTYVLSKGKSTHKETVEFNVRDTKNPKISIASEQAEIEKGAYYDPYANITSVSDEVDGELARVDTEPSDNGKGWYTIEGSYDVNNASKYFLTVVACDRNGNRTTKEFSVKVNQPSTGSAGFPTGYETGGPASPETAYVINTNSGKFHYPSCRDVKRIAAHNRWDVTMSRDEIVSKGYVPCLHCNP